MEAREFLDFINEDKWFNGYVYGYIEKNRIWHTTGNALLAMMDMKIPYLHIYEVKDIWIEGRNTVMEMVIEYYSNTFEVKMYFDEKAEEYIITEM